MWNLQCIDMCHLCNWLCKTTTQIGIIDECYWINRTCQWFVGFARLGMAFVPSTMAFLRTLDFVLMHKMCNGCEYLVEQRARWELLLRTHLRLVVGSSFIISSNSLYLFWYSSSYGGEFNAISLSMCFMMNNMRWACHWLPKHAVPNESDWKIQAHILLKTIQLKSKQRRTSATVRKIRTTKSRCSPN